MMKTMIAAVALAATLPAVAAETRVVRYDDLNLASPAGLERLDRRIDAAARSLCKDGSARISRADEFIEARKCIIAAKAGASKQVAAIATNGARGG